MRQIQQLAIVVGAAISLLSGCGPEAEVPSASDIETTSTSVADMREVDEPDPVYALQPLDAPSVAKRPPLTVVGPEDAVRVSFDDLDLTKLVPDIVSEDEAAKQLPEWLRKLDGRRVRIRGFMLPTSMENDLSSFVLTRDTSAMGFGPTPRVSSIIETTLREGITTDYIQDRAFDVAGVFHLGENVLPGEFYRLDDAIIIPGPPSKKSR